MDSRTSTKRQSYHPDHPEHFEEKAKRETSSYYSIDEPSVITEHMKVTPVTDENYGGSRFRRMEEMSHFHYSNVELDGNVKISLCDESNEELLNLDTGQPLLITVKCKNKEWVIKRSHDDFVGLDRQIHRCLYGRNFSKLPTLSYFDTPINLTTSMVRQMEFYLSRFSQVTGNNMTCGPILNWLELDNHGNHLVVMEADDSAINVPAVAAGRVIKRYQAQAPDEMSLEVGDFLSVIDMPPEEETIWWRGKKGFEVGFFPAHCVEILGDKMGINEKLGAQFTVPSPNQKSRGKLISFLRFFFKSRPSKEDVPNGAKKNRVFGCDLGELLAYTGHDVPLIISMCAEVIEEHGIVDGIYRLSGITSNLQRLKQSFDNEAEPPNLRDMKYLNDIHCISSLMKTYFRELPNPLFTHELYEKFVVAINKDDDSEKTVALHHVIQRLPPPHYRTMNKLFRHLNFCASHANKTNMTAKNLSIVWAPNLLRPHLQDSIAALAGFRTQAIIVEYMIRNVDVFFDTNIASAAIAYYPEVQEQSVAPTDQLNTTMRVNIMNAAPKLISLEEARKRVNTVSATTTTITTAAERKSSETHSTDSSTSISPRHSKLRSSSRLPPQVAVNPVSPLPSLLSLEEAQARSKNKFHLPRRGSADLVEMRHDKSSTSNSPKRTRKWFGLFTRSKSPETSEAIRVGSMGEYRKTSKTDISGPIRSNSDFQIQNLKKKISPRNSSSTWFIPPPETPVDSDTGSDFCLEMSKKPDQEDDLLSAVVAVSAKYMNNDVIKSQHRRSFTIGEPSEYRRIADSALHVSPPNTLALPLQQEQEESRKYENKEKKLVSPAREKFIQTSNNFFKRRSLESIPVNKEETMLDERPNECSSPMEISRSNEHIENISETENDKMKFRDVSIDQSESEVLTSAERKHNLNKSASTEDILPVKRVRSLSPDAYSYDIRSSPVKSMKSKSTNESKNEQADRKFQLVSSPSFRGTENSSEVSHEAAKEVGRVLLSRPLSVDSSSSVVSRDNRPPVTRMKSESSILHQPDWHDGKHGRQNYVNEVISKMDDDAVLAAPAARDVNRNKPHENLFLNRERSLSQDSCSDKLVHRTEFQLSSKVSDIPDRDYDVKTERYSFPFVPYHKQIHSKDSSNASSSSVSSSRNKKHDHISTSEDQHNNDSNLKKLLDMVQERPPTDHSSSNRPRNLSVKDKTALFNKKPYQLSHPNLTGSLDSTSDNLRANSHPNLYLRTEFSSRQAPSRTLNVSSPEKDHIKKYTHEFNKRLASSENSSRYNSDESLRSSSKNAPNYAPQSIYRTDESLRSASVSTPSYVHHTPDYINKRLSNESRHVQNSALVSDNREKKIPPKVRPKSAAYPRDGIVSKNMDLFNRTETSDSPKISRIPNTHMKADEKRDMKRHFSVGDYVNRPELSRQKASSVDSRQSISPQNLRSVSHELLQVQKPRSSSTNRSFSDESLSKNISDLNAVMNKVDERMSKRLDRFTGSDSRISNKLDKYTEQSDVPSRRFADSSGAVDELVKQSNVRNKSAYTNMRTHFDNVSSNPKPRQRTKSNYENTRSPVHESGVRSFGIHPSDRESRFHGQFLRSNDVRDTNNEKNLKNRGNYQNDEVSSWQGKTSGKQIGSFPLTLYSGNDIDHNRIQSSSRRNPVARPVSLYDNIRKSHYDNVEEIHYEML